MLQNIRFSLKIHCPGPIRQLQKMEILAFSKIPNYEKFTLGSHRLLESTVSEFLSVKVNLQICSPDDIQKKFGIDITANIRQSLYPLSEKEVLLISHVEHDGCTYFIGLLLQGKALTAIRQNRILNYLAGAISKSLQECVKNSFHNAPVLLNERLIKRMISSHIATSGNYNRHQISFLIDKVKSLMTTTFEGRRFSTGLIVTKSLPRYLNSDDYPGKVITLRKKKDLFAPIDNRFWYLADGIDSFYLSGVKDFSIQHLYLTLDAGGELQKMKPHTFLKGADTILRVYGGREMSVITKDMMEFIYQENVWRFRDYKGIKQLVMAEQPALQEEVYDSLISFILYCSKNEISTIIWVRKTKRTKPLTKCFQLPILLTRHRI